MFQRLSRNIAAGAEKAAAKQKGVLPRLLSLRFHFFKEMLNIVEGFFRLR